MDWKYSCPKCTAILNPDRQIILLGRHKGRDILLAFHSEPGNYEVAVPGNEEINEGELWEFLCPVCHESTTLTGEPSLASLNMTDGKGDWQQVVFSRIAGEYATFVITKGPGKLTVEKHGVDMTKYEHCLWHKYF